MGGGEGTDAWQRIPLVVGANQRSSSLAVRDRLYIDENGCGRFLVELANAGIDQALLLSTCDRIEVQAMALDCEATSACIIEALARQGGFATGEIDQQLYVLTGDTALRHVFCVAASLESTVVGEPHVLGQVKESYRAACAAGLCSGVLDAMIQRALTAAKRVRTETGIGAGPVSVAAAAAELAQAVHGELAASCCVMIGSGEMGELLADALRSAGLVQLFVIDTRPARAETLARVLGCHTLPIEGLAEALARADILISTLGSRTPLIDRGMVRAALRARRNQPMVMIDTGVPGDIDPLADRLDGVFLYTLDDLERVVRDGRAARAAEAQAARRIVDEEVSAFLRQRAERAAVPALNRLRSHFEAVRDQALIDARGDAEKATRLMVNRLLHDPMRQLRDIAGSGEDADREMSDIEALMVRLFDLTGDDTDHE
ncbi:MAG: glutamyl-tRNA reductase [Rhodospirillales bacterium]|nr:glutamyl-tRNA reductase [Rhodospirillales bacterium]